jgi:predicted transcriptional regulator
MAYDRPDKAVLEGMYQNKKLTLNEIAEELGVSPSTIQNWMGDYGIDRRDASEAAKLHSRKKPAHYRTHPNGYETWQTSIDGETEIMLVHRLLAIAEYGVEDVKESIVHHDKNIPWLNTPENLEVIDSQKEHLLGHDEERYGSAPWRDEDIMRELHHEQKLTMPEMAESFGCKRATVSRWLDKLGIEKNRVANQYDHLKADARDARREPEPEPAPGREP